MCVLEVLVAQLNFRFGTAGDRIYLGASLQSPREADYADTGFTQVNNIILVILAPIFIPTVWGISF